MGQLGFLRCQRRAIRSKPSIAAPAEAVDALLMFRMLVLQTLNNRSRSGHVHVVVETPRGRPISIRSHRFFKRHAVRLYVALPLVLQQLRRLTFQRERGSSCAARSVFHMPPTKE